MTVLRRMLVGAMRICVIFNPTARGEGAARWLPFLRDLGSRCTLMPTQRAGDARVLASRAADSGFETIVAAGGDGTVNEVLNGMNDCAGSLDQSRLAVLPMGTVNVFAREWGIPAHPEAAWRVVENGTERRLDLPSAEFNASQGAEHRAFIQLAGAGLDARAVELVSWKIKKKLGIVAYILAVLQAYAQSSHRISVQSPEHTAEGVALLVGNGRYYGGSHAIFHRARQDDGMLDVCLFRNLGPLTLAQASLALLTGNWSRIRGVEYWQTHEFSVAGRSRTPLELEGEPVGELPARFRLVPRSLRVIVP